LQMQKGENMSTAWRGKISVMTCSPLKVLENVMASDSIDRDVAFPKGIHPTEGEMNAWGDLQKVHGESIYGVEDGDGGTGPLSEGFSQADFWEWEGLPCFSHEADSSECTFLQEISSYLFWTINFAPLSSSSSGQ